MRPVIVGSGTAWVPFASEWPVWGQGRLIWEFFKLKDGGGNGSDHGGGDLLLDCHGDLSLRNADQPNILPDNGDINHRSTP